MGVGLSLLGRDWQSVRGLAGIQRYREQDTNLSSTGCIKVIGAPFVTAKAVCLKGSLIVDDICPLAFLQTNSIYELSVRVTVPTTTDTNLSYESF